MDIFRALSAFIQAAELGSFHQAAIAQGMTPQAISKSVRQLEQYLGVRLFHRTTHKSRLTEEGLRLYEASRLHVDRLANALSNVQQVAGDNEGTIRITASPAIGRKILIPLLRDYQDLHPRINTELILEEHFTDLVGERIDLGFRSGSAPEGQVVSRQLFAFQFIVCAAPGYLIRHGWPKTLEDLWQHRCSGFRHPGTGRLFPWEFLIGNEIVFRDIPAVFCTNESDAEYHAVLQGMAIGLLGSISANEDLRAGRLVPLLCEHASQRMGLHIYYPQRTDMPRRVRNFIDYAVIRLNNCPEYIFSGEELAALHKQGIASLSQADEQ